MYSPNGKWLGGMVKRIHKPGKRIFLNGSIRLLIQIGATETYDLAEKLVPRLKSGNNPVEIDGALSLLL